MKNTRLYLSNWGYNASLILTELESIVLENGGAIVSDWKTERTENYTITNRALDKAIREQTEHVEKIEMFNPTFSGLQAERDKLHEMQAINNEPITNNFGNWYYINFTIGNDYYYYSMNDNPFFDFHYGKLPIEHGRIGQDYYSYKAPTDWLIDKFFSFRVTKEERREAAQKIFDYLLKSGYSQKYNGSRKPKPLHVLEGEKTWL